MGSLGPLENHDHLVGTLNRHPPPRTSMSESEYRPTFKNDPVLLGTTALCGDIVYDVVGKFLGEIKEVVLDIHSGRVAYALVVVGGFLGIGRRLFAIPWNTITVDRAYQRCTINVELVRLIDAPTVDGDLLSRMADRSWAQQVHAYFGCKPYWE
jgi:sporulation protein YlmC with PRC-barrel domain